MSVVVAIDPGHGGSNIGTSSPDGSIVEKHLTLRLAYMLYFALKDSGWGVAPKLLRADDETLSLGQRADLAGELGAQLACSIHINSAPFAADGVRAFYLRGQKTPRTMAKAFSKAAPKELKDGRAVQVAVQRNQQNVLMFYECPAVLFECGFASDPEDVGYLLNPYYLAGLVAAMAMGIKAGLDALEEK